MAYMGRGETPSPRSNSDSNDRDDNKEDKEYYNWFYHYWVTHVSLDNTYVIMQMIVTFIILVVASITFITTYKSTIVDPVGDIKKIFINTHLILIGILLLVTIVVNKFSKKSIDLMRRLGLILAISILMLLTFFSIRLSLDATYNKDKFEQIYEEQNISDNNNKKSKIDIGLTGVSIKSEKEYYINECVKLYSIFKNKSYGTLGINFLLCILLIYQIVKNQKIQIKKERLSRDEAVLFDTEENIEF